MSLIQLCEKKAGAELASLASAMSGAISAMFALAVLYPMDTVKTRLQSSTHHDAGKESMFTQIYKIYKKQGLAPLMAGLDAGLLNTAINSWVYFFVYARLQSFYKTHYNATHIGVGASLLIGAIAAAANQIITLPIATVHTRMQIHSMKIEEAEKEKEKERINNNNNNNNNNTNSENHVRFKDSSSTKIAAPSMHETAIDIVKNEGIASLWNGLDSALILVCNPSITYMVFEQLKDQVLSSASRSASKQLSVLEGFYLGAIAKSVATVVTYPLILAKVRMMATAKAKSSSSSSSSVYYPDQGNDMFSVMKSIYNSRGFSGLYVGMQSQLVKATLSSAIIFMLREYFALMGFQIVFFLFGIEVPKLPAVTATTITTTLTK